MLFVPQLGLLRRFTQRSGTFALHTKAYWNNMTIRSKVLSGMLGLTTCLILALVATMSPTRVSATTISPTLAPTTPSPSTTLFKTALATATVPVSIHINFDEYPSETSWSLVCDGILREEGSNYGQEHVLGFLTVTAEVPLGSACAFEIQDAYNDGICCNYGIGNYTVYLGTDMGVSHNVVFHGNGTFDTREETAFAATHVTYPFLIKIQLDSNPQDTAWSMDCDLQSMHSERFDSSQMNELVETTLWLPMDATCLFKVMDYADNGLCCNGYWQLWNDNQMLTEGSAFESLQEYTFVVGDVVSVPSVAPSLSPSAPPFALDSDCLVNDDTVYNICLDTKNSGSYTQDWTALVQAAKLKWQGIISGDANPYPISANALMNINVDVCNALPPLVDDLYICARDAYIDGPGGILGQAEITAVTTVASRRIPVAGYLRLDQDDLQTVLDLNLLQDIAMHEVGHLLGIGPLWSVENLVSYNTTALTWQYTGRHACEAWAFISNCGADSCPPIENGVNANGVYSNGRHWDETAMDHELMTSYVEFGGSDHPLSNVTIGALQDLGYSVDYSKADAYQPAEEHVLSCPGGAQQNSLGGTRRNLKGQYTHKQNRRRQEGVPGLSKDGYKKAHEYGMKLLAEGQANQPATLGGSNVEYTAGRHVSVVYQELNYVYFVDVKSTEEGD